MRVSSVEQQDVETQRDKAIQMAIQNGDRKACVSSGVVVRRKQSPHGKRRTRAHRERASARISGCESFSPSRRGSEAKSKSQEKGSVSDRGDARISRASPKESPPALDAHFIEGEHASSPVGKQLTGSGLGLFGCPDTLFLVDSAMLVSVNCAAKQGCVGG